VTRSTVGALVLFLVSATGVALTQPGLARTAHEVREREDVYSLPPPAELHLATLGWDSAVVDVLWTELLVAYGTHWSEHRDFKDIPKYLDAILELEPTYAPVYRFVDTLLAYRPLQGTDEDVRLARRYLERGTRERPEDQRVWMRYGQFLAFIAPSFLRDRSDVDAWRKDGASAMGHAVELGADADQALSAATLLTNAGANKEAIGYLEHAYAFTEHPAMAEVHEAIGRRLATLEVTAMRDAADAATQTIDARRKVEMPSASRTMYLLLGPVGDPLRCAGPEAIDTLACPRDWATVVGDQSP
jgi:hypothetical protein